MSPRVRGVLRVGLSFAALSTLTVCAGFAQTWRTVSSSRQLHGERALNVHVEYGAGTFTMTPGPAGTLYRMDLRYDEQHDTPLNEYDATAGSLRVGMRTQGRHVTWSDDHRKQPASLALALPTGLPLALDIDIGAAEADLQLGGLSVTSLSYKTGASESTLRFPSANPADCSEMHVDVGAAALHTEGLANANCRRMEFNGGVGEMTLDFSGQWSRPVAASVNVGIGSLKLRIPRDVGVAIRLSRFLASFEQAGFVKRGDTYYSGNFQSARNRLNLDVNATLGSVEVQWID